jgi:hypothetical protein
MQSIFKNTPMRLMVIGIVSFSFCLLAGSASAEIEIEVDPFAYALKGHSFHTIYSGDKNRFDLGVFALELPEDGENENFTVIFNGYGVKWDFFGKSINGGFWGIQASSTKMNFEYNDPDDGLSSETTTRVVNNYGIRLGYRFGTDGFYLTPWISVDKNEMIGEEVELSGVKYKLKPISIFPTVHLGYRF